MKRCLSQWLYLLMLWPVMGVAQSPLQPALDNARSHTVPSSVSDKYVLTEMTVQAAFPGFQLHWEVETDKAIRYFYIERSNDEGRFALSGGTLANPGQRSYDFVDLLPAYGATTYDYRIEVLFTDGTKAYSPIMRVYPHAANMLQLYPNPAQDVLVLRMPVSSCEGCYVNILGEQGQALEQAVLPQQSQIRLSVEGLHPGTYLVQLIDPSHSAWIARFVKK